MPRELFDDDARIVVKETDLDLPKPDPDVTYTIRCISEEKWRDMQKGRTTYVLNKQTGRREPNVDWNALSDDAVDYLLLEWEGITAKGKPVPCERGYKLRLDGVVKAQLFELARTNQTSAEDRAHSFRATE
jgi:hypothetical protein